MLIKIVRESDICGGGESRVVCPRCGIGNVEIVDIVVIRLIVNKYL